MLRLEGQIAESQDPITIKGRWKALAEGALTQGGLSFDFMDVWAFDQTVGDRSLSEVGGGRSP